MERIRDHFHPIKTSEICCADHANELITIFKHQNREFKILGVLLNYSEKIETIFLLNNSDENIRLKQKLGKLYNKFALIQGLELRKIKILLESAQLLFASLPEEQENLGYLATANSNLAYIWRTEGNYEKATKFLDQTAAIERKISDLTGEVLTKINKSAVYNEMGAYRDSYFTIKDVVHKLEKKIEEMRTGKDENFLKKSKKFIETLQLLIIAYINFIVSLENLNEDDKSVEAKNKKETGSELCFKFLGENHQLSGYFKDYFKNSVESMSNVPSDVEIYSIKSSVNDDSIRKNNKIEKIVVKANSRSASNLIFDKKKVLGLARDLPEKQNIMKNSKKNSEKSFSMTINGNKELPGQNSPKILSRQDHSFTQKSYSRNIFKEIKRKDSSNSIILKNEANKLVKSVSNTKEEQKPTNEKGITTKTSDKSIIKTLEKPSENTIERLNLQTKENPIINSKQYPIINKKENTEMNSTESALKIIRIPGSALPSIPLRPCMNHSLNRYHFSSKEPRKDYSYLLDPLLSPISTQFDTYIGITKTISKSKRIVVCCLQLDNTIPNLAISASAEDSNDFLSSEFITINDLQRILTYLHIFDVLPIYIQPRFVNSFQIFCYFFLMPFIRVVPFEENNSEKIELWANAESLIPEMTQIFLNTICSINLYFIEKLSLRLVIFNASEEEIDENGEQESENYRKCIRIEIALDEKASESLLTYNLNHDLDKPVKFVDSVKTFNTKFIAELDSIISELELCIKDKFGPLLTFDQFVEINDYILIRARIVEETFDKVFWTVEDNRVKLCWDIKAKQLSKANSSPRKNNLSAMISYSYSQIHSTFGLRVDKLDKGETAILAYYLLECMKFDVSKEEDDDNFESASIINLPLKNLKSFQYFLTNDYKIPVKLTIVGVGSSLIGIKAGVFDNENCIMNCCWFLIDNHLHSRAHMKNKWHNKYNQGVLTGKLNDTDLLDILDKENGWNKLVQVLKIKGLDVWIETVDGYHNFESLESALMTSK